MGRVIIDQYDNYGKVHRKSMKCKSEARAFEIQAKLPNIKQWQYFAGSARLANLKRKQKPPEPTIEEMMVKAGLI